MYQQALSKKYSVEEKVADRINTEKKENPVASNNNQNEDILRQILEKLISIENRVSALEKYPGSSGTNKKSQMTENPIRIVMWNTNGLTADRIRELFIFLCEKEIDIALISETHSTKDSFFQMRKFSAYWTNHSSGRERSGTELFVNKKVRHYPLETLNGE